MTGNYVHGYSTEESERLVRQAGILSGFIHANAIFAPGSRVLEAGCGVGAQTIQLAQRNPQVQFVAIDRSVESLDTARNSIEELELKNVKFQRADIHELPFADAEFDGAFLCFVLEHLAAPQRALREVGRVMRAGATIHAFEGDHGSVLTWPDDPAVGSMVAAIAKLQKLEGGDACLGRRLCPLLKSAGFVEINVEPVVAYADSTRPHWVEEFGKATITEMFALQETGVLARGLLGAAEWRAGMQAVHRATGEDGTFAYTFFRAFAKRSGDLS
ncbi:MAG TPA: methyltransferase domain-containing protein [Steroidobacteraceae bacterium]|nr:methyltransferase domain-containing protein [Steroidobacteraceae bacterium]